jgi:AcrR family transcriptional regulator
LQAAWRLMREDAAHATLGRIAAEAGVSRQALYLHFDGRAGLLLAMVRWVDERERFAERVAPLAQLDPRARLEGYLRAWLGYLPALHPVPGVLARAQDDPEARAAWTDRMAAFEALLRVPLRKLHRAGALRRGLTAETALDATRALASVHAWEHLVHERGWSQRRAEDAIWNGVDGAVLGSTPPPG